MIGNGTPAQIFKQKQKFTLLVSKKIVAEIKRVLSYQRIRKRHRLNDKQIRSVLRDITASSKLVKVKTDRKVVKDDPDDDKFIACALDGGAEYIVSGDPHLYTLKEYEGIRILKPREFLTILNTK